MRAPSSMAVAYGLLAPEKGVKLKREKAMRRRERLKGGGGMLRGRGEREKEGKLREVEVGRREGDGWGKHRGREPAHEWSV